MTASRMSALAACILAVGTSPAHAQAPASVELEALRTPTSPVFVLLGTSPASVERPTTVRAFAATLLSATDGLGKLPESFALEVGPYWLRPNPTLSFDQFYRPTLAAAVAQTLSLSIGTAPLAPPDGGERAGTSIGMGVRVTPVVGGPSRKLQTTLDSLDAVQDEVFELLRARERAGTDTARARLDGAITEMEAVLRRLAVDFAAAHYQERVGFKLDVAAAAAAAVPGDVVERGRLSSLGVWATAGYRQNGGPLEVLGLGRLIWGRSAPSRNLFDAGARVVYQVQQLALSVELVNRTAFDVSPDEGDAGTNVIQYRSSTRLAGIIEYGLGTGGYLFATFGQDHAVADEDAHGLIAVLGVNVAFGRVPRLVR